MARRLFIPVFLLSAITLPAIALSERSSHVDTLAAAGAPMPDGQSATTSPAARAEQLENSLRAVEWYTNEYMRKALQAEADGDFDNARLFGDKAIASDQNAIGLREQAASAWQAANEQRKARQVWYRAGDISRDRAVLLDKRIAAMRAQWQADQANGSAPAASRREHEIVYLQSLMLTARQWAATAGFYARADENTPQQAAWKAVAALLPPLQQASGRLQVYQNDPRLKNAQAEIAEWQQKMPAQIRPH